MVQSLVLPAKPGHAIWTFRQIKLLTYPQALASAHVDTRHAVFSCRVRKDTRASPLRPSTCRAAAKSTADLRPQFCHRQQLQRMQPEGYREGEDGAISRTMLAPNDRLVRKDASVRRRVLLLLVQPAHRRV